MGNSDIVFCNKYINKNIKGDEMSQKSKTLSWFAESKHYLPFLTTQLFVMMLVPALAELGISAGTDKLSGIQMLFWVNLFALVGIAIIYLLTLEQRNSSEREISSLGQIKLKHWLETLIVSITWPFLSTLAYFVSLEHGPASLTSVGSRSSLVFYFIAYWILAKFFKAEKNNLNKRDYVIIIVTFLAIIVVAFDNFNSSKILNFVAVPLVILAGFTNAFKIAYTEIRRTVFDSVLLTLNMELITVFFSGLLLILTNQFYIPSIDLLITPVYIGILANALGFWTSIEGYQRASNLADPSHKTIYLVVSTGVLFLAQIVFISVLKAETLTQTIWLTVIVLALFIAWYRITPTKNSDSDK